MKKRLKQKAIKRNTWNIRWCAIANIIMLLFNIINLILCLTCDGIVKEICGSLVLWLLIIGVIFLESSCDKLLKQIRHSYLRMLRNKGEIRR